MPLSGYVAAQVGDNEPHEGFKVLIVNGGAQYEDKTAQGDTRVVFHVGTSLVGRYGNGFHSVVFDAVRPDGRRVSLHTYRHINPAGEAPGLLRQEISASPQSNVVASRYREDFCDPTVRAPH